MTDLGIMCGLPLSGKSTYAKKLQKEEGWTVLCPDEFRKVIYGQAFYKPGEGFVWASVEAAARALLALEHKVLIDATNSTTGEREKWKKLAWDCNISYPKLFRVVTSYKTCIERAKKTQPHMVEVVAKQSLRWKEVVQEEDFSVIVVKGE